MSVSNILHLTDLHLASPPTFDQKTLLKGLLEDLAKLRFTQDAPTLVLFTGDLAFSGGSPNAYEPVLDYLMQVLEALGLSEDRLIVCPGNHDADRGVIGPRLPDLRKWRTQALTRAAGNSLSDDAAFRLYTGDVFRSYSNLAGEFGKPFLIRSALFTQTYFIRDLGIAVVSVNTAALSSAGLTEDGDRAQLFLSERSLIEGLDAAPAGVPILVVGHHPLNWLNDETASFVERILASRSAAYFSGHLHEAAPRMTSMVGGAFMQIQSGALYMGRDFWNGYATYALSEPIGHPRIRFRRWFELRREFGKAEDVAEDGTFYPTQQSAAFWAGAAQVPSRASLSKWRTEVLQPHLKADLIRSLADGAHFARPEFEREIPFRSEAEGRVGARVEQIAYDTILESPENYVIHAQAETGKTTFLRHLAVSIAENNKDESRNSIPVVIQFGSLKPYKSQIEGILRQKLPDLPEDRSLKSLLEHGDLTIMVDDVDFSMSDKRKALVSFISSNPKCRYILTTSSSFVDSAAFKPEITPDVPFTFMKMKNIRNGQLLALIEGHGTTDPLKADQMLERVLRDANTLSVPLTAVTGTLLIQIISQDPDKTLLNQAALVERYVEILLQKYAPKDLLPGTFDFINKVDLLGSIAEFMVRADEYTPEENIVLTWCQNYLKGYGLKFSAAHLIDYFVESRIFDREGNNIKFRLRMFLEFFVAKRMVDDKPFRDYIFDDERYLCFINEISLYSALNRKDLEKLDLIYQAFLSLSEKVWAESGHARTPSEVLADVKIPDATASEEELHELSYRLGNKDQLDRDRQILLDGVDDIPDSPSQLVTRSKFHDDGERWHGHLVLLSSMLKHTELIPDWEKRKILAGVIEGWVKFGVDSLGIVSNLAKERRVIFNGVTYRTTLPADLPVGEVARRLTLVMPTAAARMATTYLGTEKLRIQLEDGLGTDAETAARQLMRISILADLGIDDLSKPAKKAAASLKGHRYLEHVFARKLYEVAVRFRLSKPELLAIKNLSADTFGAAEGSGAKRRSSLFEGMTRQRLLLERGATGASRSGHAAHSAKRPSKR